MFIDSAVTEPYLGPPLLGNVPLEHIKNTLHTLAALYHDAFASYAKIVKKNGAVVCIFPLIAGHSLPVETIAHPLGFFPAPTFSKFYNNTKRQSFIYSRPNQKVQREIFVFVKK